MPEEWIITEGPAYEAHAGDLGDGDDLEADPTELATRSGEITGVVHGADCDIRYIVKDGIGGSDVVDVTIKTATGEGITPLNPPVPINENRFAFVRVTNTSGGPADYAILGYEVE